MEDSNKTISPLSSPNPTSPGNNENESDENQRNVEQKKKNFMSPTISTAAKITSPKSKILSEWKSRDIESQSQFPQMGNSNSVLKSSISKSPSNSSQKNVVQSDKITDEIDELTTDNNNDAVCYDPLKNYLSPRPKFLRHRPNRKREIFGETEINHGFRDSIDSLRNENEISDEQVVVNQENLDQIEEVIEKKNCGSCIRVLLMCLITISVLFFYAMCLCPMSSSVPKQDCKGNFSIGYQHFVNLSYYDAVNVSFKVISLRSLESGAWGVDKRKVSKLGVEKGENFGKVEGQDKDNEDDYYLPEYRFWNEEFLDEEPREFDPDFQFRSYGDEYQDVEKKVASEAKIGDSEVNSKAKDAENVVESVNGVSDKGSEEKSEAVKEKSEVKSSGVDAVVTDLGESIAPCPDGTVYFEANSRAKETKAEVKGVNGVSDKGSKEKSEAVKDKSEVRSSRVEAVVTDRGETIAPSPAGTVYVEPKSKDEKIEAVYVEPKSKDEKIETVPVNAGEDFGESLDWNFVENEKLPPGMTSGDLIWLLIVPVAVLVYLFKRFCCKGKKKKTASSQTGRPSPDKSRSWSEVIGKSRLGRPPLVERETELVQRVQQSSELNPPSIVPPHETFGETSASRIVPRVTQGKDEIRIHLGTRSGSVGSDEQERDASAEYTSDDNSKRLRSRRSAATGRAVALQSSGSDVPATPRRSSRIRGRGATSPWS